MIKRVLFNIEHLNLINLQEEYYPLLAMDGVRFVLKQLPLPNADGMTLLIDDRIICCFGYIQVFPGVAEVWLLPSIYMTDAPLALVKEVKGYIESTAQVRKWHRVQTITRDIDMHRKWMHVLGFDEEGPLRKYYQGEDYIVSVRFFDWSQP